MAVAKLAKFRATITFQALVPYGSDAWDIARAASSVGTMAIGRAGGHDILPDIVRVTMDGRRAMFKPHKRKEKA